MDLHQKNQSHFNLSNVFLPEFPVQCERDCHQWRFEKDLRKKKEKSASAVQIPQGKRTTKVNN